MDQPRRFVSHFIFLLAALGICLASPISARAATAKQVDEALEKGKAYIYSLQQKNGTWDETITPPAPGVKLDNHGNGQFSGHTALALYALLAAGESPQNPKLKTAIDFLVKSETTGTYALGLRMQVWLMLPRKPEYLAAAKRDVNVLLTSIKTEGSAAGFYDYVKGPGKGYSHSRSQYGVLGVWAAEQMGIEIPTRYWEYVEKAWIGHQAPDGGWTYMLPKETEHATTPGMTAVGVATLFITQDYTRAAEGLMCKGNLSNPSIDAGLKWMGEHMHMVANDKKYSRDFPFITLYAVERIGVAAGIKYFKGIDWFQQGANWLLKKQGKTGGWSGGGLGGNLIDTSFAMLFLARGRAPIAFNKLDYSKGEVGPQSPPWNQRPRDVANVTRWIGNQVERDLAWQVVPTAAPLSDLVDAPVLYISGNKVLAFDDAEKAKLKAYVTSGGMIVGNADCGGIAFTNSFRKLAQELFPDYEMRELPAEHPLYTGNFPRAKWRTKPSIWGVTNGIRELMLLVPTGDPAKWWQSRMVGGKEEFWQIGGALFLYVSEGKDLRYRGENHLVFADPKVKPTRSLAVHRLQHQYNWDPEPGGWPRMVNVARNEQRIDVQLNAVKLAAGQLPATGVAHMTGTAKFTLTPEQQAELKRFVAGGGTLLIDAAGGSSAFADAAEAQIALLFPSTPLTIIPESHKLYAPGGKPIDQVKFRKLAQKRLVGQSRSPQLKGIEINGRLAVIYSREDLTGGIVGQAVEGVMGYEPETATNLVAAVLTYAAPPEPAPSTKPSTAPSTKPAAKPTTKSPAKATTAKPAKKPAG